MSILKILRRNLLYVNLTARSYRPNALTLPPKLLANIFSTFVFRISTGSGFSSQTDESGKIAQIFIPAIPKISRVYVVSVSEGERWEKRSVPIILTTFMLCLFKALRINSEYFDSFMTGPQIFGNH